MWFDILIMHLDVGAQDVAHQALTTLCQELRDLDNQQLRENEEYVHARHY
jgi:hypothetical protein